MEQKQLNLSIERLILVRSYAMEMFQFLIDEHRPGTVFQFEITAELCVLKSLSF